VKQLKILIDFFVESNIWVAISVVALLRITNIYFEIVSNGFLQVFVFTSVIFGYNFIKHFTTQYLLGIKLFMSNHSISFLFKCFNKLKNEKKIILIINTLSIIISFVFFFKLKSITQLLIVIPLLLSIFYTISFGNKTLRNIEGLKIYVVGITWSIVTVLLPIKEFDLEFSEEVYLVFLQRFLFIIALILPFEIRDLSLDSMKLKTVPQKIGTQKTKIYGFVLLLLFFSVEYFKFKPLFLTSLTVLIVTLLFLLYSNERQSKYYSSFFVEGIPIFWYILLMVF
jgi:hypothetical protein